MKIAVTAKGPDLNSEMDPRFGRAAYIVIVDTETLDFEAFDNSANQAAFKGAGIQAAVLVSDNDAQVLLTGYCGPNAFSTLEKAGVKVVNDQEGRVIDAVQNFKQGDVAYAESANKDGHW